MNRVCLGTSMEEGSDYINASWLPGYLSLNQFILTQHPKVIIYLSLLYSGYLIHYSSLATWISNMDMFKKHIVSFPNASWFSLDFYTLSLFYFFVMTTDNLLYDSLCSVITSMIFCISLLKDVIILVFFKINI